MKSSKFRYLTSGALGACLFASALTQSLQAIPGDEVVYLENGYTDVGGVLVLDPGWMEDRQDPISFEITEKGGRDAISVTVGYETSDHVRPNTGQFYDTQGKKIVTSDGTNDYIAVGGPEDRVIARASIYLDASYQTQPAYAHLWTRYVTGPDDLTEDGLLGYGILGFTSFVDEESPLNPRFRVWDPSKGDPVTGYLDLPETIIDGYDRWYDLAIEATGECFRFYIDGKFVHELEATTEESYLTHVFLQTYNFASSRWDPVGDQDWTNTEDYTAYFSNLQVVGQSGVATIHAHANYSTLQAAIDAAHEGETVEVQSDYVETININKGIAVVGEELEEGQHSLTGTGGEGAFFISSSDSALANLDLNIGTSFTMIVSLQGALEDVVIAGNTFNIDSLAANTVGINTAPEQTHLDVVGNTFVGTEDSTPIAIYVNGGTAGSEDIHVFENTFVGHFGLAIGIEGNGEIYYNDFTAANIDEGRTLVEIFQGEVQMDGNCFASTIGGFYALGQAGAQVTAAYNYFGGGAPDANKFGDGIVATPYLLSCDAAYIEAIQAPGGTISPAYAYTNASVPATFTITPSSGSVIQNVTVGALGEEEGTLEDTTSLGSVTSYTFPNDTEVDSGITVAFNSNIASITSVVSSSGGALNPSGSFVVPIGGSKTFIATPNVGYVTVVNYEGNGTVSQGLGGLITVSNITGTDNELTVSFVEQGYDVSYVATGRYAASLTVTTDPTDTSNISVTDTVTFTIGFPVPAANAGVVVSHVLVNGVAQSTGALESGDEFVLTGVTKDTVVTFVTARQ